MLSWCVSVIIKDIKEEGKAIELDINA